MATAAVEQTVGHEKSDYGMEDHSWVDFLDAGSEDLFEKCRRFGSYLADGRRRGIIQPLYRVTLIGPLDHRIEVDNPFTGRRQEMICFDSNSYLGLHLHPRVVSAVEKALRQVGSGTPSAQLLGGTNRYLRELEQTVSAFYGREDTAIFPSGYAANIGALTGLLRRDDLVTWDGFSHASIHDGCRWSGARFGGPFAHRDMADLERQLTGWAGRSSAGRLIVTDGVFSMHGRLAPLPELHRIAKSHGARLMVDEAHSVGIIGPRGRGLEDHFGLPGSIDIIMGTFSKAPGALGGYVSGSREMVEYLRFFARPGLFTASLPAAICAGLTEAFRVMDEEPEHRERLWVNARHLWQGLRDAGLQVSDLDSPILTVFTGHERLLWVLSRELFAAGVKCGNVCYPAVARGQSILRFTVNARHTREELDRTVDVLAAIARRHGIHHRSPNEIVAIGSRMAMPETPLEG